MVDTLEPPEGSILNAGETPANAVAGVRARGATVFKDAPAAIPAPLDPEKMAREMAEAMETVQGDDNQKREVVAAYQSIGGQLQRLHALCSRLKRRGPRETALIKEVKNSMTQGFLELLLGHFELAESHLWKSVEGIHREGARHVITKDGLRQEAFLDELDAFLGVLKDGSDMNRLPEHGGNRDPAKNLRSLYPEYARISSDEYVKLQSNIAILLSALSLRLQDETRTLVRKQPLLKFLLDHQIDASWADNIMLVAKHLAPTNDSKELEWLAGQAVHSLLVVERDQKFRAGQPQNPEDPIRQEALEPARLILLQDIDYGLFARHHSFARGLLPHLKPSRPDQRKRWMDMHAENPLTAVFFALRILNQGLRSIAPVLRQESELYV